MTQSGALWSALRTAHTQIHSNRKCDRAVAFRRGSIRFQTSSALATSCRWARRLTGGSGCKHHVACSAAAVKGAGASSLHCHAHTEGALVCHLSLLLHGTAGCVYPAQGCFSPIPCYAADSDGLWTLSERSDKDKLQALLFSQPQQQRPPGFAQGARSDDSPTPARRRNRLQRELVVQLMHPLRL